MVMKVDESIELYVPGPHPLGELYIGRPGAPRETFTRLLVMRKGKRDLGAVSYLVRPAKDVLVFSFGYHHVVCVDLSKLRQPSGGGRANP